MIYFIECGEFIKIGYTEQKISRRVSAFASANPYPVKLLFAVPGEFADEQILHRRFREFHHKGEWFKKTPEVMAGIIEARAELESKPPCAGPKIDVQKFASEVARSLGLNETETETMMRLAQLSDGVQA